MAQFLTSSRRWGIIIIVVLFALVLRLGYWYEAAPIIDRDSVVYCMVAERWQQTDDANFAFREYIGSTPPGYIFLLKSGFDLGVPILQWGYWLGIVCSILLLIPLYLIGRMLDRHCGGEVLMITAALHPYFVRDSVTLLRETPCLLFYAWGIYALAKLYKTHQWQWVVLVGGCSGIGFLLRYEAVELLLLLGFVCILLPKENWHNKLRRLLVYQLIGICTFFTTTFCWSLASGFPTHFLLGKFYSKLLYFF